MFQLVILSSAHAHQAHEAGTEQPGGSRNRCGGCGGIGVSDGGGGGAVAVQGYGEEQPVESLQRVGPGSVSGQPEREGAAAECRGAVLQVEVEVEGVAKVDRLVVVVGL